MNKNSKKEKKQEYVDYHIEIVSPMLLGDGKDKIKATIVTVRKLNKDKQSYDILQAQVPENSSLSKEIEILLKICDESIKQKS